MSFVQALVCDSDLLQCLRAVLSSVLDSELFRWWWAGLAFVVDCDLLLDQSAVLSSFLDPELCRWQWAILAFVLDCDLLQCQRGDGKLL